MLKKFTFFRSVLKQDLVNMLAQDLATYMANSTSTEEEICQHYEFSHESPVTIDKQSAKKQLVDLLCRDMAEFMSNNKINPYFVPREMKVVIEEEVMPRSLSRDDAFQKSLRRLSHKANKAVY